MASTRLRSKSSISTVTDNENATASRGKAFVTQQTTKSTRHALGALSNSNNMRVRQDVKKSDLQKAVAKPRITLKSSSEPTTKQSSTESHDAQIIVAPTRPANIRDIDVDDSESPLLVSDYINEIYIYLRRLEKQQAVRKDYMKGYEITPKMRGILIDWLVQVHQRFHLLQETLYLTVAIIDRYLQEEEVAKNKLQLVGVTAMWVASKYEEMYAPEIADFVYITDNAYTKVSIRQMERRMLKCLKFDLGRPLPIHFLRRYSKAAEVDTMLHSLAKYFIELSILDYQMVHYHPSEISAASLCLSMKLLGNADDTWDETVEFYSTYNEQHLQPIMNRIALMVQKSYTSKQQAIRQKYQGTKLMRISTIAELQCPIIEDWAQKALDEEAN